MAENQDMESFYRSILSLRNSFDSLARPDLFSDFERFSSAKKSISLKFESIRLDMRRYRATSTKSDIELILIIRDELGEIIRDPIFREIANTVRFRWSPPTRDNNTFDLDNLSVFQAATVILSRLDAILGNADVSLEQNSIGNLRRVIPEQRLAPAKFDIVNGKISLVREHSKARNEDLHNVGAARNALTQQGRKIIEALERSNCDRRLLESMQEVQSKLEDQGNIIELALINITLEKICKGAAAELPEALHAAIEGQTAGIGMYVAQFSAWQKFSENAASVEMDLADVEQIGESLQAAIDTIIQNPHISEAEVPRILRGLRSLISDPGNTSKRAAFAILRTVENLVAKIYQYGADFLEKTASKTINSLSSATSKLIVCSLLTVALAATNNLGGITSKISEATWMRTASEIVKKQIERLQD